MVHFDRHDRREIGSVVLPNVGYLRTMGVVHLSFYGEGGLLVSGRVH